MATKRQASTPATSDGTPVNPATGEVMNETFGDDDQDLTRFEESVPAQTAPMFSKLQLMHLAEAEDPLALLAAMAAEKGVTELSSVADVLGDGTSVIPKDGLLNREFYVISWRFHESAKHEGKTFCAVQCMDMNKAAGEPERMFVFTDGGSGIHDELAMFGLKNGGQTVPMHAPYGLSPSIYKRKDENGVYLDPVEWATTWRFANAPFKP